MSDSFLQAAAARTAEVVDSLSRGTWATDRAAYDAVRMYYRWTFMPSSKERKRALALIAARRQLDYADRDLYTFGVYTGSSVKFWLEQLGAIGIATGPMWGFDSFEGLPDEAEGVKKECAAWDKGAFSAADQFGVYTFGEVRAKIEEFLGPALAAKTKLIKGFFSDSLTPTLAAERGMKPALLIDMDVDLYISCYQCLDWLYANKLIVPGTVIYYDDVSVVKAHEGGELMAHNQLCEKYQAKWKELHESCWECISVGA